MWENKLELHRTQMILQFGACAFHAGYLMLQTRTHNMQYFTPPAVQYLQARLSMLRYTYSGSFVCTVIIGYTVEC